MPLQRLHDLLALGDRIVVGVQHARFHAKLARTIDRGFRLFLLVMVSIGQRNQEPQWFHSSSRPGKSLPPSYRRALHSQVAAEVRRPLFSHVLPQMVEWPNNIDLVSRVGVG